MKTTVLFGQPSWNFSSDKVEAAVTAQGGHLAPVRFRIGRRWVEPFSIAPWAEERLPKNTPGLLQALRGDFFCAPFGGNETPYRGERHPAHGESANRRWRFHSLKRKGKAATLHLSLQTKIRKGRIDKFLHLRAGETAVYCRHVLTGLQGEMNFGHHAMLKFPERLLSGRISTSAIRFAQVLPAAFEDPALGGYSSLKPGVVFSRLDRVPSLCGGAVDVSRYPARPGFEDLLMIVHAARRNFAWTAVTFPDEGYVWFSLKDPRILQSTILWISNGGRHYPPWNGRHVRVMGLEDVTSYFHFGLAESTRNNPIRRKGYLTSLRLRARSPLTVNYIMGVAAIPRGFQSVQAIRPVEGGVSLHSPNGKSVHVPLDLDFLYAPANETQRD